MSVPLYSVGDRPYLKESAALGFLEACPIGSVHNTGNQWTYSMLATGRRDPSMPLFGERITHREDNVRYYSEDELVSEYQALVLARGYLTQRLADINSQIITKYPGQT